VRIRETIGESKMNLRGQIGIWTLGLALALGLAAPSRVAAQDKDHVVSLDELKSDAAKPSQTRADNEADVRHLLQSEAGQQALKQAKVDYSKVDKAISQLSDDDLSNVAQRSRQADADFAAGGLTATLIIVIVCIVVLIVVLALVF
jgi:CHASE3 domain sensor protein